MQFYTKTFECFILKLLIHVYTHTFYLYFNFLVRRMGREMVSRVEDHNPLGKQKIVSLIFEKRVSSLVELKPSQSKLQFNTPLP
jgi:hypothetical protein